MPCTLSAVFGSLASRGAVLSSLGATGLGLLLLGCGVAAWVTRVFGSVTPRVRGRACGWACARAGVCLGACAPDVMMLLHMQRVDVRDTCGGEFGKLRNQTVDGELQLGLLHEGLDLRGVDVCLGSDDASDHARHGVA